MMSYTTSHTIPNYDVVYDVICDVTYDVVFYNGETIHLFPKVNGIRVMFAQNVLLSSFVNI